MATGCTVGDLNPPGSDDGDLAGVDGGVGIDATSTDAAEAEVGGIAISVSPSAGPLSLGTSMEATVTVTSNEFSGDVALSLDGAPSSWTVTFTPATLSLAGTGTLTATLDIEVPSTGEFGTIEAGESGTISLDVVGEGGDKQATAAVEIAADNVYIIHTAQGVDDTADHGWPEEVMVKVGTIVRYQNDDSTSAHRVHADGEDHQDDDNPIYELTAVSGSAVSYCHTHQNTNFKTTVVGIP